ncbi:hypothetical protein ABVV53_12145 [Novosphingobium sp. RD2P27]|uniref:Glycosyltransferase RgtA/B/C/D-like domain-containing protein n=1 Tax=Novosphingobium kalidii TaxID=3230299 RepID=A0ABV2D3J2_9SPHN
MASRVLASRTRGQQRMWMLSGIAALLSLIPVLFVPISGFVDAPAHMARHHIMAMAASGGPLSRYFEVQWHWIGNLGEDIPAALIGRWLGGEMATRLITAVIAPLTIAGIIAVSRAAHGRVAASAMLALPFAFHQAWMYGFLNYCFGTALAFLVGAWILARKNETLAGQLGLAAAGIVVWTAHLASWGILVLLAAANELGALRKPHDLMGAAWRNAPLLLPLLPLVFWRLQAAGSDFSIVYDAFVLTKFTAFAGALRGTWAEVDLPLLAVIAVSALTALLWARPRIVEPRLFLAGLLLSAAALAAPVYLLNSWGTDLRTAPVALIILILSIKPAADPRREELICLLGVTFFAVRLTSVTWSWLERSPELERRLEMLEAVPHGGRLGYLYVPPSCDRWKLLPDEKLGSYAVTRREAFVNTLFMVDNARLVTIRDPRFQARWTSDSQTIARECPENKPDLLALRQSLGEMRRDGFDAIWISGVAQQDLPTVPGYAIARRRPHEAMLVRR